MQITLKVGQRPAGVRASFEVPIVDARFPETSDSFVSFSVEGLGTKGPALIIHMDRQTYEIDLEELVKALVT